MSWYLDWTVKDVKREYERCQGLWNQTDARATLEATLANIGRLDVDNVVCLGLGSLHFCTDETRIRSHVQLAGLMTIIGHLSKFLHVYLRDISSPC